MISTANVCRNGLLLALALMAASVSAEGPRHHRRHASHASTHKVRQLRSNLEAIRSKKAHVRAELKKTTHEAHLVAVDIHAVDARIGSIQSSLDDTRDRLSAGRTRQSQLAVSLRSATKELDATRVQVRKRLRRIYMDGRPTFLSAVAGTRTVGEIASRHYVLDAIARQDHRLFSRYVALQRQVSDQKCEQDRLVLQISGLEKRQREQEQNLESTRAEKAEALGQLRQQQGALQHMIAQFDEDEQNIASEIAAYSRRVQEGTAGPPLPAFTGRFSRPINARITSTFGMRYHPILHYTRMHAGIDFGAPIGTPIKAAADGRVVATGYGSGYGQRVIVDHGGGIMTLYGHCSAIYCSPGQIVHRGQRIAAVGNSGLSTGPHLHFEVRVNGRPVNPLGHL